MSDLCDVLKHCAERVDRYRQLRARVDESNRKAGLIEPVIAALGRGRDTSAGRNGPRPVRRPADQGRARLFS
jgi:hypothetical protein